MIEAGVQKQDNTIKGADSSEKPVASESPEEPGSEPEPEPSWSQGSYYDIFGPDFPNTGKTGLKILIHILMKIWFSELN